MTQPSSISLAQFEELRDLLEDDFIDLINTYMQDAQKRVAEMRLAYTQDDNRLGFEAAHSLKGASSNLGAINLTEMCYTLQEICRSQKIHEHGSLIDEIDAESQAVNQQIRALINP